MSKNNLKISDMCIALKKGFVKRSPEILLASGIAGMITTIALAIKATPKAHAMLEVKRNKKVESQALDAIKKDKYPEKMNYKLTPKETVETVWKLYIPTAISGVVSIACFLGADAVNLKRTAALTTAYKLSEMALNERTEAFSKYRKRVAETVDETKLKEIRDKVAQDEIDRKRTTDGIDKSVLYDATVDGKIIFLESLTGRYFYSDTNTIDKAVNELNIDIINDISGYVTLNEFFDKLDIPSVKGVIGDGLAWTTDHLIEIEYGSALHPITGNPVKVIEYLSSPKPYHFREIDGIYQRSF